MFPNKKLKLEEGDDQRVKLGNCSFEKERGSRLSKISFMKQRNEWNPFEVFPLEIWQEILEKLEDSRDILNVLRGMPQLDISINKEKRYWYIDQILPYLYDWIDDECDLKDVLTLRLVCKQWQRRVDHFLPNQAYYRAYSEDLHNDNVDFWDLKTESFKPRRLACVSSLLSSRHGYPSTKLDLFWDHPQTRNPFIFRHLQLNILKINTKYYNIGCRTRRKGQDIADDEDFEDIQLYVLKRFGMHVWHLNIDFFWWSPSGPTVNFSRNLLKVLNLTPNLKSVQFNYYTSRLDNMEEAPDLDGLALGLPELPFLETLKFKIESSGKYCKGFEDFIRVLVTRYGPQIRRLAMPLMYWNVPEFKELFPHLTELSLELPYETDPYSGNLKAMPLTPRSWVLKAKVKEKVKAISLLKNLLNSISTPNLAELQLIFKQTNSEYEFSIEEDILKWMMRFPKLQCFVVDLGYPNFGKIVWKESGTADPVNDSIPSLQTLKIPDGIGLSYNFLRCFPSLRHLEIQTYYDESLYEQPLPTAESCVQLREQIKTESLYESNIWELIPKLKYLVCTILYRHEYCDFERDTYDKMRKLGHV